MVFENRPGELASTCNPPSDKGDIQLEALNFDAGCAPSLDCMLLFDLHVHASGSLCRSLLLETLGGPGRVARASAKPLVGTSLGEF